MIQKMQTYTYGVLPLSGEVRWGGFIGGEAVYSARVVLGLDPANLNLDYIKGPNIPKGNTVVSDKVRVYPNPALDLINIVFETETDNKSVFELYDVTGKIILSYKIQAKSNFNTININAIKAGIYYYKLIKNNKIIANNKLVIINR